MPLSRGKLIGDELQCTYHGIEFSPNGQASKIPSGGPVAKRLCVSSYPLIERAGWAWIWMGEAAKADPALIPDHGEIGLDGDGWYPDPGIHLEVKANYLLPYENLADATHITYLHHGLIDTGNVACMPYRMEVRGTAVKTYRDFLNEPMPDMLRKVFGLRGERVNRTLELTSYVPNLVVIRNSFAETDVPDPQARINTLVVAVTPAGPRATHQFTAWHRERIVLIGDAVHANPPVLAQGAAMGIEDALVLAEVLAADAPVSQLLDRFVARRHPRAALVVHNSVQLCDWEVNHTVGPEEVGRLMLETQRALCAGF